MAATRADRPGTDTPPHVGVGTRGGAMGLASVRRSALFLGAVGLVYVLYLALSGQMGTFVEAMAHVSRPWVAAALACYALYYVLGVTAYAVAVIADPTSPVGFLDLMSVEATGIFFSNLSPNGTGGAPAQIYRLTRAGLTVGGAGALQYTRFIIYEAGEGIFAALMLPARLGYFVDTFGDVALVGALLFGAKVVEVAALLVVCLFPGFVRRIGNWGLSWLARRGWLSGERRERWGRLVNEQVREFSDGFKLGARNVRLMALTLGITLVQLGCLYALPYFALRAFGRPADVLTCLASGAILELLTSAIPLPGGTGGAEGGFAVLFGDMFGETLPAGYVVWRAIEYVLPVVAAIPLMGLRSRSGRTLHARWQSARRRASSARARAASALRRR